MPICVAEDTKLIILFHANAHFVPVGAKQARSATNANMCGRRNQADYFMPMPILCHGRSRPADASARANTEGIFVWLQWIIFHASAWAGKAFVMVAGRLREAICN